MAFLPAGFDPGEETTLLLVVVPAVLRVDGVISVRLEDDEGVGEYSHDDCTAHHDEHEDWVQNLPVEKQVGTITEKCAETPSAGYVVGIISNVRARYNPWSVAVAFCELVPILLKFVYYESEGHAGFKDTA